MSFSLINGYNPRDFDTIVSEFRQYINTEYGQNLTPEQFKGSNWYKLIYSASQLILSVEGNISELSNKMIDYIRKVNEDIQLPKSSIDGIHEHLLSDLGLISSVKPSTASDAGSLYISVDVDNTASDYAEKKQMILEKLKEYCTAGLYFTGAERGEVVASNGQSFTFGYDLPEIVNMQVRITVIISDSTTSVILNSAQIKSIFEENFKKMYRLGFDFEGDRYLDIRNDLPFASKILIEWSANGSNWSSDIWQSAYNQKVILENITVNI